MSFCFYAQWKFSFSVFSWTTSAVSASAVKRQLKVSSIRIPSWYYWKVSCITISYFECLSSCVPSFFSRLLNSRSNRQISRPIVDDKMAIVNLEAHVTDGSSIWYYYEYTLATSVQVLVLYSIRKIPLRLAYKSHPLLQNPDPTRIKCERRVMRGLEWKRKRSTFFLDVPPANLGEARHAVNFDHTVISFES